MVVFSLTFAGVEPRLIACFRRCGPPRQSTRGNFDIRPMKKRRILETALAGSKNVRFDDMVALVEAFGFRLSRIQGSHHIFVHPLVREPVNLQNVKGKAKPYQIRQVLHLVERYNLKLADEK